MSSNKSLYKRLYTAYFVILLVGIFFLGDLYLKSLSSDYFIEIDSISRFEAINNGIIYFGRSSAPDCRRFEPIIRDISREERIKVYYFNTENMRAAENVESSFMQDYLLKYYVESIPTIIVVRAGIVIEVFDEVLYSSYGLPIKANLLTSLLPYKSMSNDVIPYDYVSIGLLCISAFSLIASVFLKKENLRERLYLPVICVDICMFFFIIRNFAMPIGYIERYGYNGNANSSLVLIVATVIMVISNAILVTRIKEKLSETAQLH